MGKKAGNKDGKKIIKYNRKIKYNNRNEKNDQNKISQHQEE